MSDAAAPGSPSAAAGTSGDEYEIREQDRLLPIANIARIMKCALPDNAKLAKDSKETIQECVSEFILFITSEACDRCLQEKRKTVNGEDLLWAVQSLGFESYVEVLKVYLSKYREALKPGSGDVIQSHPGVDYAQFYQQQLQLQQLQQQVAAAAASQGGEGGEGETEDQ